MALPWYATREMVKSALDSAETARNNSQVDRAIASGTRAVEGLLRRKFYPWTGTRYFDWPDRRRSRTYRLWLDGHEVVSVSQLVAGGVTISSSDYFLEPANDGPPYNRIEIDLSSSASFSSGDTHQRAIAVTGVFCGCPADEVEVGELAGSLAASDSATASVSWTDPNVGVGDILRINSERMIITGRTMVDSTQNIGGDLTASTADVTVAVSDGTKFATNQILLVDSERMLVVDIAGNNLTVKRAWDGSVLAAHTTGTDVYTLTGVELDRAQLGTTLAAHDTEDAIYRHVVPDLVRELCVAEALLTIQNEQAAYGRTSGSGQTERAMGVAGIEDIRVAARADFGRKARVGAV